MLENILISTIPFILFFIFLSFVMRKSGGKNPFSHVHRMNSHMDKVESQLDTLNESLKNIERL